MYGTGSSPLPLPSMLDALLEQRPFKDQIFVSAGTEQHKWGRDETREHVSATARGLLEYGFKNGEQLLTWTGPTEVEALMAVLGAAHSGAHVVGLDGDVDATAVNAALGQRGARGLLVGRARAAGNKDRASELVAPGPGVAASSQEPGLEGAACPALRMHERFSSTGVVKASQLPSLRYVFDASHPRDVNGFLGFFQMPVYHATPCPLPRVAPFVDAGGPLYTAGYADGAGIRWGDAVTQIEAMALAARGAKSMGLTSEDVVLVTAPTHGSATMLGVCLGALQAGAKLLFPGRGFDAFQACSAITR